ncbi:translation initiation factor IF3-1, mitochondrial-like [Chenopodium quinoa]|uniref:Translation initiation factor 3 N-terminal domain-containing protein n=1 Tax=Chenopodium quinoa TaxID=63459 RepID=A0A803LGB3_CHEQI|nr:translation initiation factor IF3-1, mitochondrial-like [Chenopodium quinoa]
MSAIFCRIKETKLNKFIHQFRRYHFQISTPQFVNQTAASLRLSDYYFLSNSSKISPNFQRRVELFNSRVRFYAAPVQIKKKEEVTTPSRPRLNEEIKADILRIVTDEGHNIISRQEALKRAKSLKLDLVEVDRVAKPPVCKIMDYNRERYKKQVREKERAKIKSAGSLKRGGCKEIRVSAKSESKDVKMKADTIRRLMERGYRVKCMATGTEDQDLSGILSQISALIEDDAFVEEKRPAYLIVRHVKFGVSKKRGKKSSDSSKDKTAASPEIHNAAATCSDSPADLGEASSCEESDMDNVDNDVEAPLQCKEQPAWPATSVSSADQNFAEMFGLSHNVKGTTSIQEKQIRFDGKAAAATSNNNAARFAPSGVPNFTGPNVRPVAQEIENRYAGSAAKSSSAVRNPTTFRNSETQRQSHPHPHPSALPPRGLRQGGVEGSPSMNFRLPPDDIPQPRSEFQSQSSQPNSNSSSSMGHPQPPISTGSSRSQSTGFGTFSSTKVDAPKSPRQGGLEGSQPTNFHLPPDVTQPRGEIHNRSSQPNSNSSGSIGHQQPPSNTGSPRSQSIGFGKFNSTTGDANPNIAGPSDVTRNSAPGGLKPPIPRSDGPQKSESTDKKWGIFSK